VVRTCSLDKLYKHFLPQSAPNHHTHKLLFSQLRIKPIEPCLRIGIVEEELGDFVSSVRDALVVGLDLCEDLRAQAVEIAEVLEDGTIGVEAGYEDLGLGGGGIGHAGVVEILQMIDR
jgi:hypothetical protein